MPAPPARPVVAAALREHGAVGEASGGTPPAQPVVAAALREYAAAGEASGGTPPAAVRGRTNVTVFAVGSTKPARLFVALELPAEVKSVLTTWARRRLDAIAGVRVIDPAAMHLTLCFLGWRPLDEVESIAAACQRLDDERAISVCLGPVLWLPRRRPGVVAIRLDEDVETGRLAALQSRLAGELVALGVYRPERRPFLAHVTVARVRRSARVRPVELPAPEPDVFALRTLTLFRSYPGGGGSRYEPLASLPLPAAS